VRSAPRRNGPLLAIVAEGFFSRLSFGVISFVLPLYAYRLGLGFAEIGTLLGTNLLVAIVLKVPMGLLADRVGYRPTLVGAIALRSVVSLLLAFAVSPWHLFAIRGLHGVSIAMRDPSTASLISVHGGKERIASSFAWYQTAKSVAGSFGKGLGGIILGISGASFTDAFLVAFVLSVLPLWVVVRHIRGDAPHTSRMETQREVPPVAPQTLVTERARGPAPPAGSPDRLSHTSAPLTSGRSAGGARPSMLAAATLGMLVTGTAYMMSNLFPVLAVEHAGLSESQTGAIFLLGSVVTIAGPGFGWLSDRVSHRLVLSVRGAANIVSSILFLAAPNLAGFAAGKLTDDLGKAAFKPAWGALMARVAELDPRRRARAMSVVSLGEDTGEMVGPVVAGALWSAWGVGVLLGARIALAVVTEVYALGVERRLGLAPRVRLTAALGRASRPDPRPSPRDHPRPGPGRLVLDGLRLAPESSPLDATVEPDEVLTLLAAGTTHVEEILTGARRPYAGRITLDDVDVVAVDRRPRAGVVAVVRVPRRGSRATIADILARTGEPPEALGRAWALSGAAERLGRLSAVAATPVTDLRGTDRWFVGLATALANDPSLIVVPDAGGGPPAALYPYLGRYPGAAVVVGPSSPTPGPGRVLQAAGRPRPTIAS
jgi:MFS family permease